MGYGSRYPLRHIGYPLAAHAATTLGMLVAMFESSLGATQLGVPTHTDVSMPDRRCPVKTANPPVGGTETMQRRTVPSSGCKGPCVGDWSTGRGRAAGSAR